MKKLSKQQISNFCSQLGMLLGAGVPLVEALEIVNRICKKRFSGLIEKVASGNSLSEAMQNTFPAMVISSVTSAEKIGNLEEMLARLANYYAKRADIEEKIRSALVYPSFVLTLCLVSLIVLLVFVLPGFKTLFVDMGADLPLFSRIILEVGELSGRFWYIPLFVSLGFGLGLSWYRKTKNGALVIDTRLLSIKTIFREQIISGFRTMGTLLGAGVPILEVLNNAIDASNNQAFQAIMQKIKNAIENGERLSQAFSAHKIFPDELVQMLAVGENSGKLGEMLVNTADFYENEKEIFLKKFTAMLEPSLTLIVGLVVGIVAAAMFLPMVSMISALQ